MRFDAFLAPGFSTYAGIVSCLFIVSVVVKIGSTVALLLDRRIHFLPAWSNVIGWWTTKLSALLACASALELSRLAQDRVGQWVFATLLILATGMVMLMAGRRFRAEKPQRR